MTPRGGWPSAGGSDNVDADLFDGFDYVALDHLHGPQNVGSNRVRYCGTPLKYSFSEAEHHKSVTVLELGEKGSLRSQSGLEPDIVDHINTTERSVNTLSGGSRAAIVA